MTHILRLNLKAVELILNTGNYTRIGFPYWKRERRRILKELLKQQLATFDRS